MSKKKIGLLHGAILNSGDFLIFNRGKKLLNEFLDSKHDLIDIKRWEPIREELDVLIILGGPIVSRTLHPQSMIIKEYLEKRKIPVICLGIGISGEQFDDQNDYFIDDSLEFWRNLYESSYLFSVRDEDTLLLLKSYGLNAVLTGCPALYDLDLIKEQKFNDLDSSNQETIVTIPHITVNSNLINILLNMRNLLLVSFFIYYLKSEFDTNTKFYLMLQHGFTIPLKLIDKYAILFGFKTLDASNKSLDEIKEVMDANCHIGTRLHTHILFLSSGKPTYLFNVDNRTKAFLNTFNTESEKFSFNGIKKLSNKFSKEFDSTSQIQKRVESSNKNILILYKSMENFLIELNKFLEKT